MIPRPIVFILITLLILALTLPVWAGGWAVITLDELPGSLVAGEPVTLRFAVRQHGKTLLPGLDATVLAENRTTGERIRVSAQPVEDQAGYYQSVLRFPSEGSWGWTIQTFSSNQPMPDLIVASNADTSIPPPARANPLPVAAGFAGLILAGLAAAVAIRARTRWALALVMVGILAGGAGFSWASADAQSVKQTSGELTSSSIQTVNPIVSGQALFVAKGCVTCHANRRIEQRYVDIQVDFGPDLTQFSAAPEYLRVWLKDPAAVRPDTEMPGLELDEGEIEALIAFLNDASAPTSQELHSALPPERIVTATPADTGVKANSETCAEVKPEAGMLVSFSDSQRTRLQLVDPDTGLPVCEPDPISTGIVIDQKIMAGQNAMIVSSADNLAGRNTQLKWIDLLAGKSVDLGPNLPGWTRGIISDPQGSRIIAIVARLTSGDEPFLRGFTLVQINRSQKGKQLEKELDFDPRLAEYIAEGKLILLYGVKYDYVRGTSISPGLVRLLDANDLSTVWEIDLQGVLEGMQRISMDGPSDRFVQWTPAIALAHDREKLYIVHADADRLTTVDLIRHKVQTVDIQPRLSWIERLLRLTARVAHAKAMDGTIKQGVLSADGARLYITGFSAVTEMDAPDGIQVETNPLGLQVIQVKDGKEVARIASQAREIDISADGSYLFLRGWLGEQVFTDVYTTKYLERVAHLEGQHLYPAHTLSGESLILSRPDGRLEGFIDVLDRGTFKAKSSVKGRGGETILTP